MAETAANQCNFLFGWIGLYLKRKQIAFMDEIRITVVGKFTQDEESDSTFQYKKKTYKKLLNWSHFDEILDLGKRKARQTIVK